MSKLFNNSRFTFIGDMFAGKEPVVTSNMGESKWKKTRMSFGIKNDQNLQFLNMEYIHTDSVKTCKLLGSDGEMFEIKLNDTSKPEVIKKVADFTKIIIDLETDFEKKKEYTSLIFKKRNHEMKEEQTEEDKEKIKEYTEQINELANHRVEFVHMKDAIAFLNASIPLLKDKKIKVTGNVKSNFYNGKNNLQYIPSLIEIVEDDTPNKLEAYFDIFYDKDSIDDDKKLKKLFVNGWVGDRIKKAEKLFPINVVIDYTKIDEENDQHKALLGFMKDIFKITNKKQVHKMGIKTMVINGAETKEFTEDDLTEQQKMCITLGMNKLEDFKPKGNVYGDKIQELRVINGDFKLYPNGAEEVFPTKDITDYLQEDDSDKTLNEVKNNKEEESKEEQGETTNDLLRNLFGA